MSDTSRSMLSSERGEEDEENEEDDFVSNSQVSDFRWEHAVMKEIDSLKDVFKETFCKYMRHERGADKVCEDLILFLEDYAIQSQRLLDTLHVIGSSLNIMAIYNCFFHNVVIPRMTTGVFHLPRRNFDDNIPMSFRTLALSRSIIENIKL